MKYFKILNCDDIHLIQKKTLEIFPEEKWNTSSLFYIDNNKEILLSIPELRNFLKINGLINYVRAFGFYILNENSISPIHVDTGESPYSLNFPINNCDGSIVNFYYTNKDPIIKEYKVYNTVVTYKYFNSSDCIKIDRLEVETQPYLLKIHHPHKVDNINCNNRITLLTRFTKDLNLEHFFN